MKCDEALETPETLGLQTVTILRMAKTTPKHKNTVQHTPLWSPLPWGTHVLFFLYSPLGTDVQEGENHTLLIFVPPALALGLSQSRHPKNGSKAELQTGSILNTEIIKIETTGGKHTKTTNSE